MPSLPLVGSHGKAIELAELEDRLAALEAQMLADSGRAKGGNEPAQPHCRTGEAPPSRNGGAH